MEELAKQICNECSEEKYLYEFGFCISRGVHFKKCKDCTRKRRKPSYIKDPNIQYSSWRRKKKSI